jgi:putative redox protein
VGIEVALQEQIQFKNNHGENLSGTLHVPTGPSHSAIILGHCFTCSRHTGVLRRISEILVDLGFYVLRFDFSGNGQSEGEFSDSTYSKQVSDIRAATSLMSSRGVSWLGLAGHSMGAMVALLAAAAMDSVKAVCALAARSSALTIRHFFSSSQLGELEQSGRVVFSSRGRSLQLTQKFFNDADRYDLPAALASLGKPLLVVHGDQDEIIPVAEAYQFKQLNPVHTKLAIIAGADHMFTQHEYRDQVARLVAQWFKRQTTL